MADLDLLKLADFTRKVLVVGDIQLDIHIEGAYTKMAAEAPIPVFYEATKTYNIAGTANIAKNLLALGIDVDLVGIVSAQDEIVPDALARENIRTTCLIRRDGYSQETVTRYFEHGIQLFQSLKSSHIGDKGKAGKAIFHKCEQEIETQHYTAMVLVDYGDDLMSDELGQSLIQLGAAHGIPTIVRPLEDGMSKFNGADYVLANTRITSNEKPYPETKDTEGQDEYNYLIGKFNIKQLLVMLSTAESLWFEPNKTVINTIPFQCSERLRKTLLYTVRDAALAAISFGVACKLSHHETMSFVTLVAEYIVKSNNENSLNLIDLLPSKVIYTTEQLKNFAKFLPKNKKVVLTTGCYDLLHAGHADNLRLAKEFGDILIILLNSDISVKKLKGPSRPVFSQVDRIKLLSGNKHVDFIILFDEEKPSEQVKIIDPDVLVKGDDYTEDRVRKAYPFVKDVGVTDGPSCIGTTGFIAKIMAGKTG